MEAEVSNVKLRPSGSIKRGAPLVVEFDLSAEEGVTSPILVVSVTKVDFTVWVWHAYPLVVEGPPAHRRPLAPPCRWRLEATAPAIKAACAPE